MSDTSAPAIADQELLQRAIEMLEFYAPELRSAVEEAIEEGGSNLGACWAGVSRLAQRPQCGSSIGSHLRQPTAQPAPALDHR